MHMHHTQHTMHYAPITTTATNIRAELQIENL